MVDLERHVGAKTLPQMHPDEGVCHPQSDQELNSHSLLDPRIIWVHTNNHKLDQN